MTSNKFLVFPKPVSVIRNEESESGFMWLRGGDLGEAVIRLELRERFWAREQQDMAPLQPQRAQNTQGQQLQQPHVPSGTEQGHQSSLSSHGHLPPSRPQPPTMILGPQPSQGWTSWEEEAGVEA